MYYKKDLGYVYPERSDEHMITVKHLRDTNFDENYPFLDTQTIVKGGYAFSLFNGEDKGKTLSISRSKNSNDSLRLVVTEGVEERKSTHFLIKGLDKVVGNLNQKYPFITPPKIRFMNSKELTDSQIVRYIDIAEKELSKYYRYLEGEYKVDLPASEEKAVEEVKPKKTSISRELKLSKDEIKSVDKLFEIFESTAESLPKHISSKISPSTGKVLMATIPAIDGTSYTISKKMNPDFGNKLKYVHIEKTFADNTKKYLAIDYNSKKFLKTDSKTGKPMVVDGALVLYTAEEAERLNLKNFFEETLENIFRAPSSKEIAEPKDVTVLKIKEPVKIIDIDDPEIEPLDFEDKKINNLLDKISTGELNESDTNNVQIKGPILVPKKRGRKPKVKSEAAEAKPTSTTKVNQEPTKNEKTEKSSVEVVPEKTPVGKNITEAVNIAEIEKRVVNKAISDADALSELYINTLVSRFRENVETKITQMLEKITEVLKF